MKCFGQLVSYVSNEPMTVIHSLFNWYITKHTKAKSKWLLQTNKQKTTFTVALNLFIEIDTLSTILTRG